MRICWSQTLLLLVVVGLGILSLTACGQKGPLTLPEREAPTETRQD